jgi:ribosomal protein S18 acetylase RimI-like enzyme
LSTNNNDNSIIIRNIASEDIPDIVELQKQSFPLMAKDGLIWDEYHLESHIRIFPEGQFCAELGGKIIASSSSLVTSLTPDYREHTYKEATAYGMFTNHTLKGDSLYGADISTHPDSRGLGIATLLYDARKDLAVKLNLRRIIAGGRLFNYCEYAKKNYMKDSRSLNYASFIEWINPKYASQKNELIHK